MDYGLLREIWWLLTGVLLIGFAVTDGYDLGVGAILRLIGKDDVERRMALEAIEPHWEGHQVWFILAGGAVFAAWPSLYATSFSGFYFAMLLVLLALILRPVGFNYRNKVESPVWRAFWDGGIAVAGIVPPLVFGVAFGNLFLGVPFHFTDNLLPIYDGSFWALFHPFALLVGVLSLAMLIMHGAAYAAMKIEEPVSARAAVIAKLTALITLAAFLLAGVWLTNLPGHEIVSVVNPEAASNPLYKEVALVKGAWMSWHTAYPLTGIIPALAALMLIGVIIIRAKVLRFFVSGLAVAMVILTAGGALFPFLLPSSTNPNHGLTIWDASSSKLTLMIMLVVVLIFIPLILAYTTWAVRVMRGQVTRAHVLESEDLY